MFAVMFALFANCVRAVLLCCFGQLLWVVGWCFELRSRGLRGRRWGRNALLWCCFAALEQDSKTAKHRGGGKGGEDGNVQISIFTVKSEVLEKWGFMELVDDIKRNEVKRGLGGLIQK